MARDGLKSLKGRVRISRTYSIEDARFSFGVSRDRCPGGGGPRIDPRLRRPARNNQVRTQPSSAAAAEERSARPPRRGPGRSPLRGHRGRLRESPAREAAARGARYRPRREEARHPETVALPVGGVVPDRGAPSRPSPKQKDGGERLSCWSRTAPEAPQRCRRRSRPAQQE